MIPSVVRSRSFIAVSVPSRWADVRDLVCPSRGLSQTQALGSPGFWQVIVACESESRDSRGASREHSVIRFKWPFTISPMCFFRRSPG